MRVGWEEDAPVSAEEKNEALVRRLLEAHAKGDLDTLEEIAKQMRERERVEQDLRVARTIQ
jgi:hypothetical protein